MSSKVESWGITSIIGATVLLAEWLFTRQEILLGLSLYSITLILLLLYSTFRWLQPQRQLVVLTIPVVIRLMAYTLPTEGLSPIFAQLLIGLPVGLSALIVHWLLQQQWFSLRFGWQQIPQYLGLGIIGIGAGFLLYQFQQPALLTQNNPLLLLFYAFVLVVIIAFFEEWLFRGIMQSALSELWGNGFLTELVVAFFYTALNLGQGPWPFLLLIFVLSLGLSWLRRNSNNLAGVYLVHSIANLTFFFILPSIRA